MLISVARWLLCIVAIVAVLVEWSCGGNHPVVWLTLCGVAWALRFIGRDSKGA